MSAAAAAATATAAAVEVLGGGGKATAEPAMVATVPTHGKTASGGRQQPLLDNVPKEAGRAGI